MGLMRVAADASVARVALFVCASALAACASVFACPAQAAAYDYWYKVYDADMNLLYYSEDSGLAATSVDVNTLSRGIWFECYYNGREDPLPSVACMGNYCYVTDASSGEVISTRNSSVAAFEDDDGSGIDYTRSDCLATDELGNTKFQFDEDGYFCGILYTLKFYEVDAVTAGTQVEFSMYLVPYLSSVGGKKDESTCVTFTLTAAAAADEDGADAQEGDEAEGLDVDAQAAGSTASDEGAAGGSQGGSGSETGSASAASSSAATADDDAGAAGEADAASTAPAAATSARSAQGAEERASEAQQAAAGATSTGAAAEQDASAVQTLGSLGTVLAVAGTQGQGTGAGTEPLALTGLPWLYVLLVAVLAAMAPLGALACVLQHRRRAQAASRLVGA